MIAVGLALSLFIGLSLGVLGGGGSILAVPILTYALGLPPKAAIAGSLLLIGVTSGVALIPHLRSGRVCFRTAFVFGGASMAGAYLGGRVARHLPDALLLAGFGAMMLVTGIAMLRRSSGSSKRAVVEPSGQPRLVRLLAHGLGVGVVTGTVGAGGGFLIVPALVLLGRMPIRRAIATSLMIIAMNSFAGFAGHGIPAGLPWGLLGAVTVIALAGSLLGGLWAKRLHQESLQRGFAGLVLVLATVVVVHLASAV